MPELPICTCGPIGLLKTCGPIGLLKTGQTSLWVCFFDDEFLM